MLSRLCRQLLLTIFVAGGCLSAAGQESPYFITDHHHLPDAGALGLGFYSVAADPKLGNGFIGSQLELEYRPQKWWSSALQLDGQTTFNESTIFTGYTWENKFKLYPARHWINAVLSVAWEDANAADKTIAEIEGHSGELDFSVPNAVARKIREQEIETKLILSRDYRGWNFAGNVMAVKVLSGEPWQFGYSLGTSRPFSTSRAGGPCTFCRKRFSAGLEFYGGLGDVHSFGLQRTLHYLGPDFSWQLSERWAVKAGPHFGLTGESQPVLMHVAVIYDIPEFAAKARDLFSGR